LWLIVRCVGCRRLGVSRHEQHEELSGAPLDLGLMTGAGAGYGRESSPITSWRESNQQNGEFYAAA